MSLMMEIVCRFVCRAVQTIGWGEIWQYRSPPKVVINSSSFDHEGVYIPKDFTECSECRVWWCEGGGDSSQSLDGPRYDWVDLSMMKIPTKFRDSDSLEQFLSNNSFIKPNSPADAVMANICSHTDWVCHGRENAPRDFFFVYNTFFSNLHITLSFDDFTIGVLRILNVAPTQLHLNSWTILQAFWVLLWPFQAYSHTSVLFVLL